MKALPKTLAVTAPRCRPSLLAPAPASAQSKFACEPGETYVMNVMVSAHPYWVPVFEGFKQAAEAMGCEVVFSGTPDYDITKQIASFEQDLVKSPKGILLHPMQADPVHRADQPRHRQRRRRSSPSRRTRRTRSAPPTSPRTTSPRRSSRPRRSPKLLGGKGEYAVLENPGQSNHDLRVTAFIAYMEENFPDMKLVGRQASNQDSNKAYQAVQAMLQANPNLGALWIPEAGSAEGAVAAVLEAERQGHHHARRRHADHAGADQGGQHPHGAEPQPGHAGLHGLHRHLPGGASRPDRPVQRLQGARATTRWAFPFIDNGFAVITKDNADDFDLERVHGRPRTEPDAPRPPPPAAAGDRHIAMGAAGAKARIMSDDIVLKISERQQVVRRDPGAARRRLRAAPRRGPRASPARTAPANRR